MIEFTRDKLEPSPFCRRFVVLAFKLMESAQKRWQKIHGAELAAEVWRGTNFVDGVQVKEQERIAA